MSARLLEPGAWVTTDFSGRVTRHRIVARTTGQCQTGVMFQVEPKVPKSGGAGAWICSGWFTPEEAEVQPDLF